MTKAEKTLEKLEGEGWIFSHRATVNRYRSAGLVSPMKDRDGKEWCRIHEGRCVGSHAYQMTMVMYRELGGAENA